MYKILRREDLSSNVVLMDVEAPMVAKKCLPGQFIILRVNEEGERIPLTIAHYDREKGVVTIIFQTVGATTMELAELKEGEDIRDRRVQGQEGCRYRRRPGLRHCLASGQGHP